MSADMPRGRSLSERTAGAVTWRFAAAAVSAVAQFAVGVLLARLLAPADFGLIALAFVVIGFARPVSDLGIGNAIVQRADLTERHVRTGFTLSLLFGGGVALVLAAVAPIAAIVLRDPQVTPVLRVLACGFVFTGAAVTAGALLRRRLDFRTQFFIDAGSYLLGYGAVASTLALRGYGVWSLVCGGLGQTVLASAGQIVCARHSLKPLLARAEARDLMHFAIGSSSAATVNYIAVNADNFIVGRAIGVASLGLYNRAYTLMNLPYSYASSVISSVLFPALAQAQTDPARLRRAFLALTRLTAMVAASAMATMAIVAPHLVNGVYGERWSGAVLPLQILCAAGYFRALYHLGGVAAQSAGRVYQELRNQVLYAAMVVGGTIVGARFGLPGVAAGVSVAILGMFALTSQLVLSATGLRWQAYARVQGTAMLTAVATAVAALAMRIALEAARQPSLVIAVGILAAAAVPWSVSMLLVLREPAFESVRSRLPGPIRRLDLTRPGVRHLHAATQP